LGLIILSVMILDSLLILGRVVIVSRARDGVEEEIEWC